MVLNHRSRQSHYGPSIISNFLSLGLIKCYLIVDLKTSPPLLNDEMVFYCGPVAIKTKAIDTRMRGRTALFQRHVERVNMYD